VFSQTFGDLKVMASTPITDKEQWFAIACGSNSVNLLFGDTKTLRIKSTGVWTHSVLFWRGKLTPEFTLFKEALEDNCVIYQSEDVVVLYLKNNVDYGSFRVSCRLHKSGNIEVRSNIGNPMLNTLDDIHNLYKANKGIHVCINRLLDIPLNTDLEGSSYTTKEIRQRLYKEFTKPFIDDPATQSLIYETQMEKALNIKRRQYIRSIMVMMFTAARRLSEIDV
jgi:hypothetical protein